MNLNIVVIAGHLVRDPDMKYLPSGVAVCEFRLATNEKWTDRKTGQKKEEVCFIDVTFFKEQAESVKKYLTKGAGVLVEGKLKYREWEDKKDGSKRRAHSIEGHRWQFTGSKPEGEPTQRVVRDVPQPAEAQIDDDSALPF